ncbi:hypothetical protein M0811_04339 [Anaeramoeba ignava]|uniref:Uncharacterized protein n=1 Tax=Anaeramoeba ignava TaxID=1746090 RepID=A0A9Q0RH11_ANAIG|nr:hypothetical protein M0811_04339 [Anaeramoeba ignava]
MYPNYQPQSMGLIMWVSVCCVLSIGAAFIAPSIAVAYPDKDIDCPKNLWTWIVVCNSAFGASIFLSLVISFLRKSLQKHIQSGSIFVSFFLLTWSIVGLVWATSDGVKDKCGKLYNVALGDSIVIIVLNGLGCLIICVTLVVGLSFLKKGMKMYRYSDSQSIALIMCISVCCVLSIGAAFIAPSIAVAYPDKDIDCPKNLWNWIVVCNSVFGASIFLSLISSFFSQESQKHFQSGSMLLGLFLLAWAITGLVWATSDGVKDKCGKLYNVALGDSITIIVLNGLGCLIICVALVVGFSALAGRIFIQLTNLSINLMNKDAWTIISLYICCFLVIGTAFIAPSVAVAYPDKDIDCPKNLWSWIVVCNSVFGANILLSIIAIYLILSQVDILIPFLILNLVISTFLLCWAIIGYVWAKSDGVKDQCGKLYNVTLGDSTVIIVLNIISCLFGGRSFGRD